MKLQKLLIIISIIVLLVLPFSLGLDFFREFNTPYQQNVSNLDFLLTYNNYINSGYEVFFNSSEKGYLLSKQSGEPASTSNIFIQPNDAGTWFQANFAGGSGNKEAGLLYIFDEPITFYNNTEFCIDISFEVQQEEFISFYSNTDFDNGFAIARNRNLGGTNTCDFYKEIRSNETCYVNETIFAYSKTGNTSCYTGQSLKEGGVNSENLTGLQYLLFEFVGSVDTMIFQNLSINNYTNGSNELPIITVELNESIKCINQTGENVVFNYSISSTDSEGDVVLYDTHAFNYLRRRLDELETFSYIDSEGRCRPNIDFLRSNKFYTNNTIYYYEDLPYGGFFSLNSYMHIFSDYNIDDDCEGYLVARENVFDSLQPFKIFFPETLLFDSIISFELRIPHDNTIIDSYLLDNLDNIIDRIKINYSDGNITVFRNDILLVNNEKDNDNNLQIVWELNNSDNNITFSASSNDFVAIFNTSEIEFDNVAGVFFNTTSMDDRDFWAIRRYRVETDNFDVVKSYTTESPTGSSFNITGNFLIDIYYTDDFNQENDNYGVETIKVKVEFCEDFVEEGIGSITDDEDIINYFGLFKTFFTSYCTNLDNTNLGNYGSENVLEKVSWCDLFVYAWFMISIFGGLLTFILSRFNLLWGLEGFSFTMMWGTIFFVFPSWLIVTTGFLFALSSGFLTMSLFTGNRSGGVNNV